MVPLKGIIPIVRAFRVASVQHTTCTINVVGTLPAGSPRSSTLVHAPLPCHLDNIEAMINHIRGPILLHLPFDSIRAAHRRPTIAVDGD